MACSELLSLTAIDWPQHPIAVGRVVVGVIQRDGFGVVIAAIIVKVSADAVNDNAVIGCFENKRFARDAIQWDTI